MSKSKKEIIQNIKGLLASEWEAMEYQHGQMKHVVNESMKLLRKLESKKRRKK